MNRIPLSNKERKKIIVISPHPDDEILGCGGTIMKALDKGDEVFIVYLTSGDSNQNIREKEALAVCKYLSIRGNYFLRFEKNGLSTSLENIEVLIKIFQKIKPNIVFVNHDQDGDIEHKIAYQLTMESYWRYNSKEVQTSKIQGLLLYEIHKPMETYNLVEDISKYISRKMEAMSYYKSQLRESKLDLAIKGLNRYRGSMHEGMDYAEVFQVKKWTIE